MIIIRNNIIPFQGYKAMNLFGLFFVRKTAKIDEVTINHEKIHTKQMVELLFIFFYIWYGIEYLIKLIVYKSPHKAYRKVGFEAEAYTNERDMNYIKKRKYYSWWKYM